MWDDNEDDCNEKFLVNPSRTAMQQLGSDLRALIDSADDLYVWPTGDMCHAEFAQKHYLKGKAWLYINPVSAEVRVSYFSHPGTALETARAMKGHPRMKYFKVEGAEEKVEIIEEVTDEDRALLAELYDELKEVR